MSQKHSTFELFVQNSLYFSANSQSLYEKDKFIENISTHANSEPSKFHSFYFTTTFNG